MMEALGRQLNGRFDLAYEPGRFRLHVGCAAQIADDKGMINWTAGDHASWLARSP